MNVKILNGICLAIAIFFVAIMTIATDGWGLIFIALVVFLAWRDDRHMDAEDYKRRFMNTKWHDGDGWKHFPLAGACPPPTKRCGHCEVKRKKKRKKNG